MRSINELFLLLLQLQLLQLHCTSRSIDLHAAPYLSRHNIRRQLLENTSSFVANNLHPASDFGGEEGRYDGPYEAEHARLVDNEYGGDFDGHCAGYSLGDKSWQNKRVT